MLTLFAGTRRTGFGCLAIVAIGAANLLAILASYSLVESRSWAFASGYGGAGLLCIGAAVHLVRRRLAAGRVPRGAVCERCGCSLRGLRERRCPECGMAARSG